MDIDFLESFRFLGTKLINIGDFSELVFRFSLNIIALLIIVRYPYLKHSKNRNYVFSYITMGTTIFLLCYLLNSVKLEMGFALGLFAVFGIIRYRTDSIPFKQMTYLFVVIGLSVINALSTSKVSYTELLFTNGAILAGLWLLEKYLKRKHESSMKIVYENIANIHIDKYDVLLEDLKKRTGFDIRHFDVLKIDYLKDIAIIVIYFNTDENSFVGGNYVSTFNDDDDV